MPGKPSVPFFRQLWLVLGGKLMEINSNLFSRWCFFFSRTFVHFSGVCVCVFKASLDGLKEGRTVSLLSGDFLEL